MLQFDDGTDDEPVQSEPTLPPSTAPRVDCTPAPASEARGRRSPLSGATRRYGRWTPPVSCSKVRSRSAASIRSRSALSEQMDESARREANAELAHLKRNLHEMGSIWATLRRMDAGGADSAPASGSSEAVRAPSPALPVRAPSPALPQQLAWAEDRFLREQQERQDRDRRLKSLEQEMAAVSQKEATAHAEAEELGELLAETRSELAALRACPSPQHGGAESGARRRERAELLRQINGLIAAAARLWAAAQLPDAGGRAEEAVRPLSPGALDGSGCGRMAEAVQGVGRRLEELAYRLQQRPADKAPPPEPDGGAEREEELAQLRRRNEELLGDVAAQERRAAEAEGAAEEAERLRGELRRSTRDAQELLAQLEAAQGRAQEAAELARAEGRRCAALQHQLRELEAQGDGAARVPRPSEGGSPPRGRLAGAAAAAAVLRSRCGAVLLGRYYRRLSSWASRRAAPAQHLTPPQADNYLRQQVDDLRREVADSRKARDEALQYREQELQDAYVLIKEHERRYVELEGRMQEAADPEWGDEEAARLLRAENVRLAASNAELQGKLAHLSNELLAARSEREGSALGGSPEQNGTPRGSLHTARSARAAESEAGEVAIAKTRCAYLGLELAVVRLPDGGPQHAGLRVIEARGPAHEAGFAPGDLVTNVAGNDVGDLDEFREVVSNLPLGEAINVRLIRDDILYETDISPAAATRRPGDGAHARHTNRVILRQGIRGAGTQDRPHPHRQPAGLVGAQRSMRSPRAAARVHPQPQARPSAVPAPPRNVSALRGRAGAG